MLKWRKQQSVAVPSRTQFQVADDPPDVAGFAGSVACWSLSGDMACRAIATGWASTVHDIGAPAISSDAAATSIAGAAACTIAGRERVAGTLP